MVPFIALPFVSISQEKKKAEQTYEMQPQLDNKAISASTHPNASFAERKNRNKVLLKLIKILHKQ